MHAGIYRTPDEGNQGVVRMAEISDSVAQSVTRFLTVLRQRRRIQAAYIYGSQAKGAAAEWSDIDLAVISLDFSADLFQEQLALMRLAAQVDDRIEARPFAPEDFNASDPMVSEIRRTGVRVM
jgi:predicted nucleotidyltransferase